jgi:hypothetical protein
MSETRSALNEKEVRYPGFAAPIRDVWQLCHSRFVV